MAEETPFDIYNLAHPVFALVQLKNRLSIPPDVIYRAVLDPSKLSPSKQFYHFDSRDHMPFKGPPRTDLFCWIPVEDIHVVEIVGECDTNGELKEGLSLYATRKLKTDAPILERVA